MNILGLGIEIRGKYDVTFEMRSQGVTCISYAWINGAESCMNEIDQVCAEVSLRQVSYFLCDYFDCVWMENGMQVSSSRIIQQMKEYIIWYSGKLNCNLNRQLINLCTIAIKGKRAIIYHIGNMVIEESRKKYRSFPKRETSYNLPWNSLKLDNISPKTTFYLEQEYFHHKFQIQCTRQVELIGKKLIIKLFRKNQRIRNYFLVLL